MNINILWHVFQLVIFIGYSAFFAYRVFENHLKVSREGYWIRVAVYMLLMTVAVCLFLTELSPWKGVGGVGVLLVFLLTFIVYKSFTDKKPIFLLFVMFVLLNVQINSLLLAQATLDFHILPALFSYENGDFLFLSAIYGSLSFALGYFLLAKYYKRVVDEDIILRQTKYLFWLPMLFYMMIEVIFCSILKNYDNIRKEMFLPLLGLNLLALITYYAALKSINDNFDAVQEQEKLLKAEKQLDLWQAQYENLRDKMTADARERHDWRQHIIAIMGFTENKDLQGLNKYLSEYKEKYLAPDEEEVCDIPALNLLFQYYRRQAEARGTVLHIENVVIGMCRISVSELTIVFGNLLENALEVCARTRDDKTYIQLKIIKDKNNLILLCSNSCDEQPAKSGEHIKACKNEMGVGIASVQDIVRKYNGYMKIENVGNVYKVYAYLQIT